MHQGRKGIGSHKHGKHGHPGQHPRLKQNAARNASRQMKQAQLREQRRRSVGMDAESVGDAINKVRPR